MWRLLEDSAINIIAELCLRHIHKIHKSFPMEDADLSSNVNSMAVSEPHHYTDVIMTKGASQITSLAIVYSAVHSGGDQRKHQSSASLAFVRGIPAQRASNAENVSIWWRHHVQGVYCEYFGNKITIEPVITGTQWTLKRVGFVFGSSVSLSLA